MTHGRSVFVSPPDKRAEANAARAHITANSKAGKSDHLAIIAAVNGWTAAWAKGGRQQAHAVSPHTQLASPAVTQLHACSVTTALGCTASSLLSQYVYNLLAVQYCTRNFLSESALDAIEAGRGEVAATLADMGLLPPSFLTWMHHHSTSSHVASETGPHEFDTYCDNARVLKAALCAGWPLC